MNSWYARYPGDYMRDTSHLSLSEHGAYNRLLDHYYSTGRSLPASKDAVYRICGAFGETERAAVDSILSQFFTLTEDGYHNPRSDRELAKRRELKISLSRRGQRGANARWRKTSEDKSVDGDGQGHASANGRGNGQTMEEPQPHPQPHPKPQPEKPHTMSPPSAAAVCRELLGFWNENRGVLSEALKLTPKREEKLRARLKADPDFEATFKTALVKAKGVPFLCGSGERGWKASFDWFIANDENCLRVIEGRYDETPRKGGTPNGDWWMSKAASLTKNSFSPI
jgi:uncharacterized protein YdaU (DUF1376 family)